MFGLLSTAPILQPHGMKETKFGGGFLIYFKIYFNIYKYFVSSAGCTEQFRHER